MQTVTAGLSDIFFSQLTCKIDTFIIIFVGKKTETHRY